MNDNDKAICPVCKTEFNIAREHEDGDIIKCPKCEIKLEIESVFPPEVREVEFEDSGLEDVEETLTQIEENAEELVNAEQITKDNKEAADDYKQDDL